ncbi:transcriptional regulator, ArsR family [Thermoleophilum album]|uniref:Transcriptional regulator, ArsR family n=1 Tax=Thermoleophilum album TaxID=29539 RepID=A0A1H6FHB8_THEAL|nr:transcriptional regulator, ArsR family [Thermoleophilum album]
MSERSHAAPPAAPSAPRPATPRGTSVCDVICLDLDTAERLRRQLPPLATRRRAAARAGALADPTRVAIAWALAEGRELCVCDLAWVLERSQSAVSHHLRRMRDAGLVDYRRRGRTVMYALTKVGAALLAAARTSPTAS